MNLGKALAALKFDNRMKDWNLNQGTATSEELEQFNTQLKDLSEKCIPLDLESKAHTQRAYSDSETSLQ